MESMVVFANEKTHSHNNPKTSRYGIAEVLSDETLSELNIDVQTLDVQSDKRVVVKCLKCQEKFLREFKRLGELHRCPSKVTREDGLQLKWCNTCSSYLAYACFSENKARHDGVSSICSGCISKKKPISSQAIHQKKKCQSSLYEWTKIRLSSVKSACKHKGMDFNLDIEYMMEQWESQTGKCFYLKIPLKFHGGKSPSAASLERLDSHKPYVKGNVVWASRMANLAKNDSEFDEFESALLKVFSEAKYGTPRIEVQLRDKDATMPHRSRSSDAGYDIKSLVDIVINPNQVVSIDTGMAVVAPAGFYFTIEGRSSLYMSGVVPFRGIIDGGYVGNMVVSLMNVGGAPYHIKKGDRIAQLCLHQIIQFDLQEVNEISEEYDIRGTKGFGSSGR